MNSDNLLESALAYRNCGLSVLPARRLEKRPSLPGWKNYQLRIPNERQILEWFSKPEDAICIVTGQVSGNLEMLDFDQAGDRFEAWKEKIPPELFACLVIGISNEVLTHSAIAEKSRSLGLPLTVAERVARSSRYLIIFGLVTLNAS